MALVLPASDSLLSALDHARLHRVVAVDAAAPEQSLTVGSDGVVYASSGIVGNLTGNAATVTTNANLTGDVTSIGNISSFSGWSNGNIIFVPISGDIGASVSGADDGDTVQLASGQYTLSDEILIEKQVTIQGVGPSTFIYRSSSGRCLHGKVSNIRIRNLSVYGNGSTVGVICFNGVSGNVLSGCVLDNVIVNGTATSAFGGSGLVIYTDAGGTIINSQIEGTTSDSGAAISVYIRSTAEADISVVIRNTIASLSGGSQPKGLTVIDDGSSKDAIVYAYNSKFLASGGINSNRGVITEGADAFVYLNGCIVEGSTFDVATYLRGKITVSGTNLVNGLTSGTIIYEGSLSSKNAYIHTLLTVAGAITMGSATVNSGVFQMIQGAVASDPTFSITQSTNDVEIKQTVGKMNLTAVGEVVVNDSGEDVNYRVASAGNANMVFVDAGNNKVFIGRDTCADPNAIFSVSKAKGYASMSLESWVAGAEYPFISLRKSRNATPGSYSATVDTEGIGGLTFYGASNSAHVAGAGIMAKQDGTVSTYCPTNLILRTYSATAENANQLVLHNDGNVFVGALEAFSEATGATPKLQVTGGGIANRVVEDTALANDGVLDTTIDTGYGILIVTCVTNGECGVYRIENQTIVAISQNANFTTTKDNADTINVYFDTDSFDVQNKDGAEINITVAYYGA